jgi:hypothetical protein
MCRENHAEATVERISNSGLVRNPFKVGDKVITKVRGVEVEGIVTKLWQNEVQVRTPDNELRWRTVYTVWYPGAAPIVRRENTVKTVGFAVGAEP